MVFSSIFFLFIFLPIVLAAYYLLPKKLGNITLLLASVFFYGWGEPVYVVLLIFSCVFNYVIGVDISKKTLKRARSSLIYAVVINLLIIGFFKYFGFVISTINGIFGLAIAYHELPLPIGVSFYTFQALSYVIDVYRGRVEHQNNFINFALYLSMFPQLIAGPIVKYKDIEHQINNRELSKEKFGLGTRYFICGLGKKVLLANNLGFIYTQINEAGLGEASVVTLWIGIICYTLQIYFDFSGYSDMAIGLGKMFGFDFNMNFNYPYISKSITEFWRRWHISLSTWFKEYVYIPLGGNRVKPIFHLRNIMAVWLLTGLWHGASWNFVFWGLYYGIILLLEKYFLGKIVGRMPSFVQHFYAMLIVAIGWVFFSQPDMTSSVEYISALFGAGGNPFFDLNTLYLIKTNVLLILAGMIGSCPIILKKIEAIENKNQILAMVIMAAIMLVSISFLVYDTYNPFLYFRF